MQTRAARQNGAQDTPLKISYCVESNGGIGFALYTSAGARSGFDASFDDVQNFARDREANKLRSSDRSNTPHKKLNSSAYDDHTDINSTVRCAISRVRAYECAKTARDAYLPSHIEVQQHDLASRGPPPFAPLDGYLWNLASGQREVCR